MIAFLDKLFVYSCEWNYRTDHCMYTSVCKSAEKKGVAAVHGNRGVFHGIKQPAFKAIFDTFLNVRDRFSLFIIY